MHYTLIFTAYCSYIHGNPLGCDCKMKWLLYFRRMQNLEMDDWRGNFPICNGAAGMKGKRVDKLQLSDIRCGKYYTYSPLIRPIWDERCRKL